MLSIKLISLRLACAVHCSVFFCIIEKMEMNQFHVRLVSPSSLLRSSEIHYYYTHHPTVSITAIMETQRRESLKLIN